MNEPIFEVGDRFKCDKFNLFIEILSIDHAHARYKQTADTNPEIYFTALIYDINKAIETNHWTLINKK